MGAVGSKGASSCRLFDEGRGHEGRRFDCFHGKEQRSAILRGPGQIPSMGGTGAVSASASAAAWKARLRVGTAVALDSEPVELFLDVDSGRLGVRQHHKLYRLSEMRVCIEMPQGDPSAAFELAVVFANVDALVFQFDEAGQRSGFRQAIDQLAQEARQGRIQEDVAYQECDDEDDCEDRPLLADRGGGGEASDCDGGFPPRAEGAPGPVETTSDVAAPEHEHGPDAPAAPAS